MFKSEVD